MIAKWIAQALLNGQDHLILSTAKLAEWQSSGCRVSLGAPYGLHGQHMVRQVYQWKHALIQQLIAVEPHKWPVGQLDVASHGNRTTVVMPELECQAIENKGWRVPLVPSDQNHSLDSWLFDLNLSAEEFEALKPIAGRISKRMLLRCEITAYGENFRRTLLWNDGRLTLARLSGIENSQFETWFSHSEVYARLPPPNCEIVDTCEYQDARRAYVEKKAADEAEMKIDARRMPVLTIITQTGTFIREVDVMKLAESPDLFHMQFVSRLSTARNPEERQRNFDLILERDGLFRLRELIDAALREPPPHTESLAVLIKPPMASS